MHTRTSNRTVSGEPVTRRKGKIGQLHTSRVQDCSCFSFKKMDQRYSSHHTQLVNVRQSRRNKQVNQTAQASSNGTGEGPWNGVVGAEPSWLSRFEDKI